MSGIFISTGKVTNNGKIQLEIDKYLNFKIKDIVIHIIPISTSNAVKAVRTIGGYLSIFLHSRLKPSLTHVAIQLNLENCKDIFIIEYGQYYSEKSKLQKESIIASSSKDPKEIKNNYSYYYINDDGARLFNFTSEYLNSFYETNIPQLITRIIASNHYNISLSEYNSKLDLFNSFFHPIKPLIEMSNSFYRVECNIKNNMTLEQLINTFKNEKWAADKYSAFSHNCQEFAAEIIKILGATRKNEEDKLRMKEKIILPGRLISALWDNEPLSKLNTLGRIPIFGHFHDLYQCFNMNISIEKNQ